MSEAVDDGGPAFPSHDADWGFLHFGLSMRDWFAGQALAGLASANSGVIINRNLAIDAYNIADAMLARRKEHAHD